MWLSYFYRQHYGYDYDVLTVIDGGGRAGSATLWRRARYTAATAVTLTCADKEVVSESGVGVVVLCVSVLLEMLQSGGLVWVGVPVGG